MPVDSEVKQALREQWVETPSWAYGNTGTRFKVFKNPAAARDAYEKLEDAALVNRLTGVAPSVALHIPWDKVDDYAALAKHAADLGLRIGAINPNVFQEDEYRLGSVCHPDPAVRRKATDHLVECAEIAGVVGSPAVSLWFADGTNYPGQDDVRARQDRLAEALSTLYAALPDGVGMLLEYKLFEPSFYTMDVPDWGTSLVHCLALGERANVLVDTGHHAPGTNIEFIVASLLRLRRLGGFHFNSRFYADDDLLVGAADPYQLFRIMNEIVAVGAHRPGSGVAFMLDQCHNIEDKVAAEVRSVMNVQEATAKALLVDREALAAAQAAGDVLGANAVLVDAFSSDVRPLLAELRQEMGLDPDPLAAYARSGHAERARRERAAGGGTSWGG
jgi:L-rhamnose isomerase/sugar isomerase